MNTISETFLQVYKRFLRLAPGATEMEQQLYVSEDWVKHLKQFSTRTKLTQASELLKN